MRFDLLSTFPEIFASAAPAALGVSIPARAHAAGVAEWHAHDIRAYTTDKHGKTDDRPFGGGPGMVMTCQPVWDAARAVEAMDSRPATRVLMTPQGEPLTQARVEDLATKPRLLVVCPRYEGLDERVIEALDPVQISLGDYVLSGGELAAMVLMDTVIRLLPGALGHEESAGRDSFGEVDTTDAVGSPVPKRVLRELDIPPGARLLEGPQYTKPRVWQGREIPEILLSGDHGKIQAWRLARAQERTRARRPELLKEPSAGSNDDLDPRGGKA
ncbi:MAG: tRNA (guanine(37)-N(1))-methyltransferase [Planctomycetota bacterium]